jgi:hypothetical protein
MSTSSLPVRWLQSLEWRRGFFAWARTDGVTWVYIFKVLAAAFITLWLAMRLELPQPRTAMITVFIVMQPQSGQVFAKSFYRVLGTLAGSAVMVALIALFAQNTELFLPAWRSGWACARPAPCATAPSAPTVSCWPVTPRRWSACRRWPTPTRRSWRRCGGCWKSPWGFSVDLGQRRDPAAVGQCRHAQRPVPALRRVRLVRHRRPARAQPARPLRAATCASSPRPWAWSLRNVTVFEDPHMRRRNGRLVRMNSEFMAITTRFNALHQLLERLRAVARCRSSAPSSRA